MKLTVQRKRQVLMKELPSNENCNYTKAFEEEVRGAMGPQNKGN